MPRAQTLRLGFFGLLLLLLIISSWPVLSTHPNIGTDNEQLIEPLRSVHSFGDYAEMWRRNQILDVAPIRDFSFWVELRLNDWIGFENQQATNLMLWAGVLIVTFLLLKALQVASPLAELAIALMACHPIMTSAIYWKASRKHLLSALFVIFAAYFLVVARRNRDLAVSILFYTLAVFSQPINLGFPLFAAAWIFSLREIKKPTRSYFFYLSLLGALALLTAVINYHYYQSDAFANTGAYFHPKFRTENLGLLQKRFLVWGRDFYQLIAPFRPAIFSYNLHRIESIAGLVLMGLTSILLIIFRQKIKGAWLIFIVMPILAVTVRLTSQGGFDIYLLTPLLGTGIFLATSLSAWFEHLSKRIQTVSATGVAIVVIALFLPRDASMAQTWSAQSFFYRYGFESEAGKSDQALYARFLLNGSRPDTSQIFAIAESVRQEDPEYLALDYIYGKSIYLSAADTETKYKMFKDNASVGGPWYAYFWSALDAKNNHFSEAYERLNALWNANPRRFYLIFEGSEIDLESKWTKMCELAKRDDCATIHERLFLMNQSRINAKRGLF